MVCPSCGHDNPDQNHFCGMCGTALSPGRVESPEDVVEKVPISWERTAAETPGEGRRAVEPEVSRHEPAPEPPPPPKRRSDKWWVEDGDGETTVGGPSFLGLSSSEGGGGGGYSYLFEEEKQSHAGRWVFLLFLLIAGGVLYWKWQPIRDYVLTTAISHSRPQQKPAQETKDEAAAAPGTSAPTTTLATSDAPSQPSIVTENKPEQSKAAPPKEEVPQGAKEPPAPAKPEDAAKANPEDPSSTAANEPKSKPGRAKAAKQAAPPAEEESAAEDEKPSAATQKARAPQSNPGGELVNTGERYLYGRGVARNCDQAVSYFNAAAAKQNPQAYSHLGALYATGNCVPMDRAAAYAWFRRAYAMEPSNRYFEQNLTMLWREMSSDERQRAGRQ